MGLPRISFVYSPLSVQCYGFSDPWHPDILEHLDELTVEKRFNDGQVFFSGTEDASTHLEYRVQTPSSWLSDDEERPSPSLSDSPLTGKLTMAEHAASLLQEIDYAPAEASALPPLFMINFLRQCFHPDLTLVDFPQSLTGLEYLEELESRRKRCVASAFSRLGISRATLQSDADNLAKRYPSFASWVRDVEGNERKSEALYTQLYIALRRWIMLNEFCLVPFHKYNCIAMLNLLFPKPVNKSPCSPTTTYLTTAVLHEQRETYIKNIHAVELNGVQVVRKLMDQGKREGDTTGWPAVRETMINYIRIAGKLINEAQSIDDFGAFDESNARPTPSEGIKKRDTADSGISFGSGQQSFGSGQQSFGSGQNSLSTSDTNKPLPSPPMERPSTASGIRNEPAMQPTRPPSRLEKIAFELRKFKIRHKTHPYSETDIEAAARSMQSATASKGPLTAITNNSTNYSRPFTSAGEAEKQITPPSPSPEVFNGNRDRGRNDSRSKSRNRSRSLSKSRRKLTKAEEEAEAFNRDEMMRLRAIWEARNM